jgi:hypothetical protein
MRRDNSVEVAVSGASNPVNLQAGMPATTVERRGWLTQWYSGWFTLLP